MAMKLKTLRNGLLLGAGLIALVLPAWAQTPPARADDDADSEEVVVTALKGNSKVHDTPATVQVLSPTLLADRQVLNATDLGKVVPGFQIAPSPLGNTAIILYGLGTPSAGIALDQSVLPLVDGAPNSHSRAFQTSLFDIQNIQVIKGVQAAVLGKNSSIGAVEITTRKPRDAIEYNFSASYEFELGSTVVEAGVSAPINDQLAIRVAGRVIDSGGWVHNDIMNQDGPMTDAKAVRGTLVWSPSERFDYTLSAEFVQSDITGSAQEAYLDRTGVGRTRCLAGGVTTCEFVIDRHTQQTDLTTWGGLNNYGKLKSKRVIGTGHYDMGDVTLTSVTSYQALDAVTLVDSDALAGGYFSPQFTERNRVFTQELRISSDTDGPFQFLAGVFFGHDEWSNLSLAQWKTIGGLSVTTGSNLQYHKQSTNDYSAFARLSYALTDSLKVIGGLRYNHMDKEATPYNTLLVNGTYSLTSNPPFPQQFFEKSEDNVDYSVAVQYDISPDTMVYASYGKGTKSGGFATGGKYVGAYNPATTPALILSSIIYRPEIAHIAEIGAKFRLGSYGYVNVSAYNVEVQDAQLSLSTGGTILYISRDLTSRGVNLQTAITPFENLTISGNLNYSWGRDRTVDAPLIYNPEWSGSVAIDYVMPAWDNWELTSGLFVDFRSDLYNRQPGQSGDILTTFGAIEKLGAKLKLSNDAGWEIALIGENLTDELVVTSASAAAAFSGIVLTTDRPRTFMLRLGYSY